MKGKVIGILLGSLLLMITGCANLQKDAAVKQYYDLKVLPPLPFTPEKKSGEKSGEKQGGADTGAAVLVKELGVSPSFDSHVFIYQMGPDQYQPDFYHEFITYPAQLITDKLKESLYATTLFSQPVTHHRRNIDYRLSGKITHLYGDFQDPGAPRAIIGIRLRLEKKEENGFILYSGKNYRFDQPVASMQPKDLVKGWNQGLTRIIVGFLTDFKTDH